MSDPELDDQNILIRYLLYSDQFNTEGLVYASSTYHWAGDGKCTTGFNPQAEYRRVGLQLCPYTSWRWKPGERFIDEAVEVYARVYPNLRKHSKSYPSPAAIKSKIAMGNVAFEGNISADSPGSKLIESLLLDRRPGPLYLLTGADHSTIARALKSIEGRFKETPQWKSIYRQVSRKAIIHSFADQDDTYGSYIKSPWPDIAARDMATETWGYGARTVVLAQFAHLLGADWTHKNISTAGPLGAFYRVRGDGKQMVAGDKDKTMTSKAQVRKTMPRHVGLAPRSRTLPHGFVGLLRLSTQKQTTLRL